ncbi:hypothetical protein [Leuconostoc mesenteroides]|uniref:hypothetical protein n=1 Tax=Leuconostoc mesenteroides TaxID=1245 RepID=UPI00235E2965|nr:hypothetical protein [Leuconostoc mesenteroides]
MTFDEANKIVEAFDEDPELEDWMPNSKVYEIIEGLRQEYAPTIEIVPDMKWFVRSKKTNGSYKYDYLSRMYAGTASPKYGGKDLAIYFDTKEEAELWTNPLTEAVHLPVEGE